MNRKLSKLPLKDLYKKLPRNKQITHDISLVHRAWQMWQLSGSPMPPLMSEVAEYPEDEWNDISTFDLIVKKIEADEARKNNS